MSECVFSKLKIPLISLWQCRVRKKVRSNEDLCNDIREFMSEFQFPEDHVPSFKELSEHGRYFFLFQSSYSSMLLFVTCFSLYILDLI